ncbi:MAG: hypothetical protein AAFX94_11615, partial [Myxococcota bacterium]
MTTNWQRGGQRLGRWLQRVSVGCVLVTALVSYTPISEWLATPLWAEDEPVSADLIVVLGAFSTVNGVLNEPALRRTRMGAQLYAQGLAPTVFITGGND